MIIDSDDLLFIKQQPLWTGCRDTPYIMRGGIDFEKCLLYITNLEHSWVCKLNKDQIIKDKDTYNKSIQTTTFQGILDLLQLALAFDPQAEYTFKINENSLFYGYTNVIKIYTLTWIFDCKLLAQEDHLNILKNDLFNPLLLTIQSLENRCSYFKTALLQVESEYLRRLNEKEKLAYRSKDGEEDLKIFTKDDQLEINKICQIEFTNCANYFIKYYAMNKSMKQSQSKKRNPIQNEPINLNKSIKIIYLEETIYQAYQDTLQDLFDGQSHVVPQEKSEKHISKNKKKGFL